MKTATSFRKQVVRAVVLPPLFFGFFTAVYFGLDVHLLGELDRAGQSDRLIARAEAASRLLDDREAALRGYLAAGSAELLQAYREADARLGVVLDELAGLASDDPEQPGRMRRLREQCEAWGRRAGLAIGRRAGPSARPRESAGDGGGVGRMDEIRDAMKSILDAEEATRDRRSDATRSRAWSVLSGSFGVAIAVGVILAYSSRRQLVALCGDFEAALEALQARSDRQERENLTLLSEAMKYYAIFTLDPEGRISSWNSDAERILGYRADDVLALRPSCFYRQEDAKGDLIYEDLEWAALEGRLEDERWLTRKDGFRFRARIAMVAIRDSGGKLCGYTHVVHEIEGQEARPIRG